MIKKNFVVKTWTDSPTKGLSNGISKLPKR